MSKTKRILISILIILTLCYSEIISVAALTLEEKQIIPFWSGDTMYNECISFIEDETGIYGTTLFVPKKIISIYDYSQNKRYIEGIDFSWKKGTNRIEWKDGSEIPYFFNGALLGYDSPGSSEKVKDYDGSMDDTGRSVLGGVLFSTDKYLYERQLCVTYKYDASQIEDRGVLCTSYQGDKLPLTQEKLRNNSNLKVMFYGDSIFVGCDASSFHKRAPYSPTLDNLIKAGLEKQTEGTVTLDNFSRGGWTAKNGRDALFGEVDGLNYSNSLEGYDLMILSFGMNNVNTTADDFAVKIKEIIERVREVNPNIEIVLVSCMVANPESTFFGNQKYFGDKLKALGSTYEHIAVVDFYSVHDSILKFKPFVSTTGNNINHPNDWLIGLYAQNILSSIIDYSDKEVSIWNKLVELFHLNIVRDWLREAIRILLNISPFIIS